MLTSELIKLNNLAIASKIVSEKSLLGIHPSKRFGHGIEFEQYKHYQSGDDPKGIDWKLFARTDKHLVRQSSTESQFHFKLLLDLSGSMNYEENGVSRLNFAKILLASIAYLAYIQGDSISLYAFKKNIVETLVAGGKQTFQRILYALENVQASGNWQEEAQSTDILTQSKQKEIVVFVSDFLETTDEWRVFIKNLSSKYRELIVFQILGMQELHFDLKGLFRFRDLEMDKEVELEAEKIKDVFQKNINNYIETLKNDLNLPSVHFIQTNLAEDIAELIKKTLKLRKN